MADSILRDKAKDFAKEIVLLCREMKIAQKECFEKELLWYDLQNVDYFT